jgi:hypothetical protein
MGRLRVAGEPGAEIITEYGEFSRDLFSQYTVPVLRKIGVREVARRIGASPSAVSGVLSGRAIPRRARMAIMQGVAEEHAIQELARRGIQPQRNASACMQLISTKVNIGKDAPVSDGN